MHLELENDLIIKCDECNEVYIIDKDSLELSSSSFDRNMGEEIEYYYYGEKKCEKCGRQIEYNITGYEYPLGVFNYQSYECKGGSYLQKPNVSPIYYDLNYSEEEEEKIQSIINSTNNDLEELLKSQEKAIQLSSRNFEEIVEKVFIKLGYKTELTQKTRDGGRDIIATYNKSGIKFVTIIECKKYNKKNKVGIRIVRELYGVLNDQESNKGIIVTTSSFTKDAKMFAEKHNNLIDLVDYNKLLSWVKEIKND